MRITTNDINKSVAEMSIDGKREPSIEAPEKLTTKAKKAIKDSKISETEYLTCLAYAKAQPAGHRKLKLNYPSLRQMLTSSQPIKRDLTDVSGLSRGGKVASSGNAKALTQALTHSEHLANIKNNNRVVNMDYNSSLQDYKNPNYTSFKNMIKLK
jgi:hypothetical protein